MKLLSLRNELLPSSPPENSSTLPFARSEPPPPNPRNTAKSFAYLSRVVVQVRRAGYGDVCKYNIRLTASSSSIRGIEYMLSVYARGGVAALATVGTEKDDSADGEEGADRGVGRYPQHSFRFGRLCRGFIGFPPLLLSHRPSQDERLHPKRNNQRRTLETHAGFSIFTGTLEFKPFP